MFTKVLKNQNLEKRIITLEVLILFSLLFFQVYMVNQRTINVAVIDNVEKNILSLSSTVSSLEFDHISRVNEITLDMAHSLGFKDTKEPIFVSRQPLKQSLTLFNENLSR